MKGTLIVLSILPQISCIKEPLTLRCWGCGTCPGSNQLFPGGLNTEPPLPLGFLLLEASPGCHQSGLADTVHVTSLLELFLGFLHSHLGL